MKKMITILSISMMLATLGTPAHGMQFLTRASQYIRSTVARPSFASLWRTPARTMSSQSSIATNKLFEKLECWTNRRTLTPTELNTLVEEGADVNGVNTEGHNSIYYAILDNNQTLLQDLVNKGARVNTSHDGYWLPLGLAAFHGSPSLVRCLLNNGAPINQKNKYHTTALHFAAEGGHVDTVNTLLTAGADSSIEGLLEATPLERAKSRLKTLKSLNYPKAPVTDVPQADFETVIQRLDEHAHNQDKVQYLHGLLARMKSQNSDELSWGSERISREAVNAEIKALRARTAAQ